MYIYVNESPHIPSGHEYNYMSYGHDGIFLLDQGRLALRYGGSVWVTPTGAAEKLTQEQCPGMDVNRFMDQLHQLYDKFDIARGRGT
jgi:hypothetical protein